VTVSIHTGFGGSRDRRFCQPAGPGKSQFISNVFITDVVQEEEDFRRVTIGIDVGALGQREGRGAALVVGVRIKRIADELVSDVLGRDKNYRSTRFIRPLEGTSAMLARQLGIPGGAYGYMLNLKAAKRLNRMTQKNWLAIDTLHGAVWLTGLKTLAVAPSPVLPNDESPSCIDTQDDNLRWDKTVRLEGGMRLIYPVTRGLWKFYLACCTGWIRLKSLLCDRGDGKRVGTHGS